MDQKDISQKSRLVSVLLCFFLGWLGAHRFYAGKAGTGVLMILTIGGFFGIWVLIDLIFIVCGAFKDKDGRTIYKWFEQGSV
jgi:TM2 domain-containing membrane protein YozV